MDGEADDAVADCEADDATVNSEANDAMADGDAASRASPAGRQPRVGRPRVLSGYLAWVLADGGKLTRGRWPRGVRGGRGGMVVIAKRGLALSAQQILHH
jgi:hypothetical protein